MSTFYVIDPPLMPSLPVVGDTRRFAVNRIYCVGRNYADHAREMGHDPDREPPFFFMKPANSIVTDGMDMQYPALSNDVHHEIEMVVAIGKGGNNITADKALEHVYGYGVGLDMTRRDLQGEAKKWVVRGIRAKHLISQPLVPQLRPLCSVDILVPELCSYQ